MSACRGQWSHDTERNVCALCGGTLSDHKVYVDWMARTTMDQRAAANFIPPADPWRNFVPAGVEPPFAVAQPKAMLPERVREDDPVPVRFSEVATDERAAGIARAVANLSSHEYRLGSSRWQP